jgi:hypothetical protein
MRSYAFAAVLLIALQFGSSSAKADPPPVVHDTFQNLDFREGVPGQMPSGWQLGVSSAATNLAHTVEGQSCHAGGRCAMIQSLGLEPHSLSYLAQRIDAKPYLGKRLTFRAAVRADLTGASVARLQVHTHNQDGATIVRDDMGNHPIKSSLWTFYEIDVAIASNTRDIMFGIQVIGAGTAWVDNISLTSNDANYSRVDETVRGLITRFADSRNAHDGQAAAATYAEDGEYMNSSSPVQKVKGRAALALLWANLPGHAERRIESVEFVTGNIAVAHVIAEFDEPASTLDETFLVVKDAGGWTIRVHEAAPRLLSSRR